MDESYNLIGSINHSLPKPIALNTWKHHMGYIKSTLISNELYNVSHINIYDIIQNVGNSQVDFYFGSLDPNSISNQIVSQIESELVTNINEFSEWIGLEGNDYKCLSLSDGSNWTIRLGINKERYIHIHPSRYSKKTIRVKSSTLKTAIAFFHQFGFYENQFNVENVNKARSKVVKLPPFKPSSPLVAISRVIDHFFI